MICLKPNCTNRKYFLKWNLKNNPAFRKHVNIARYNKHPFDNTEYSKIVFDKVFDSYFETIDLFTSWIQDINATSALNNN
jgi:hypothetical protein